MNPRQETASIDNYGARQRKTAPPKPDISKITSLEDKLVPVTNANRQPSIEKVMYMMMEKPQIHLAIGLLDSHLYGFEGFYQTPTSLLDFLSTVGSNSFELALPEPESETTTPFLKGRFSIPQLSIIQGGDGIVTELTFTYDPDDMDKFCVTHNAAIAMFKTLVDHYYSKLTGENYILDSSVPTLLFNEMYKMVDNPSQPKTLDLKLSIGNNVVLTLTDMGKYSNDSISPYKPTESELSESLDRGYLSQCRLGTALTEEGKPSKIMMVDPVVVPMAHYMTRGGKFIKFKPESYFTSAKLAETRKYLKKATDLVLKKSLDEAREPLTHIAGFIGELLNIVDVESSYEERSSKAYGDLSMCGIQLNSFCYENSPLSSGEATKLLTRIDGVLDRTFTPQVQNPILHKAL